MCIRDRLSQTFESVICIGNEAKYIAEENSEAKYFADFEAAQTFIEEQGFTGTVLLKASRGMRFERLLDVLELDGEQA